VKIKISHVKAIFIILISTISCNFSFGQKKEIKEIKNNLISIDTINESNFKFLKDMLSNKRIVFLGESNHHTETFNEIKFELIKFLNKELNFEVIAFESDLSVCLHSNLVKDSLSSLDLLTHSILGCWRTKSNYNLMSYIKKENIDITGFDPNHNSLFLEKKHYTFYFPQKVELSNKLFQLDSILQAYVFLRGSYLRSKSEDSLLYNELSTTQNYLISSYNQFSNNTESSPHKKLLKISIDNKLQILESSNDINQSFNKRFLTDDKREESMTKNLEFIIDSIYPNKKIIIWAHNGHISKGGESTYYDNKNTYANNSLGYRLNKKYAEEAYFIGLYGYPGIIGTGYTTQTEKLNKPKKKSLEHLLYNSNIKSFFISTNLESFKRPLYNFSELNFAYRSVIKDCYDAIIYSQDLKPAIMIKFSERNNYE
jgi:erythromycin esterase